MEVTLCFLFCNGKWEEEVSSIWAENPQSNQSCDFDLQFPLNLVRKNRSSRQVVRSTFKIK